MSTPTKETKGTPVPDEVKKVEKSVFDILAEKIDSAVIIARKKRESDGKNPITLTIETKIPGVKIAHRRENLNKETQKTVPPAIYPVMKVGSAMVSVDLEKIKFFQAAKGLSDDEIDALENLCISLNKSALIPKAAQKATEIPKDVKDYI